jgi:hypothetical protein
MHVLMIIKLIIMRTVCCGWDGSFLSRSVLHFLVNVIKPIIKRNFILEIIIYLRKILVKLDSQKEYHCSLLTLTGRIF